MVVPLLATKLHIPPVRPGLVSRPRLVARLNAGLASSSQGFGRKLTLVSAPAGYGKTTLVAGWVICAGSRHLSFPLADQSLPPHLPAAWLSLDEDDNDPARFLTYLIAALHSIDPQIGHAAQAMLQSPEPPPPTQLLTSLLNEVAVTSSPFLLVLDDYHAIETLAIHQQLAFLLEHQPQQMHLVIATREDPPLPLARLRARGQTAEIRQADLQFSTDEAGTFLQQTMGLALAPNDIALLQQRTEGWIAGLQLAALSMRGRDDQHDLVEALAGSHHYILDYLIEEVFGRQPAEIQEFLLKTSILDRFTQELCNVITERQDSHLVLRSLEQANLFLVPLDDSRQWYRYHHLFADLLRHRLSVAGIASAPLHRRASRWYADNSLLPEAIHHALGAADWAEAAELLVAISPGMLEKGEVVTMLRWCQAFPEEMIRSHPRLCLECCWTLILNEQLERAESYLSWAEGQGQETEDQAFHGQIAAARAHVARIRGDYPRVIELSERALALSPEDAVKTRCIVAVNLGVTQWYRGCLDQAQHALEEAERTARAANNEHVLIMARIFLARIQGARGHLHLAAESCRRILPEADRAPTGGLAYTEMGELLYEWNQLDDAVDMLRQGLEVSRRRGSAEAEGGGWVTLALCHQVQGNTAASQEAVQKGMALLGQSGISPLARLRGAAYGALTALARGDRDAAAYWAQGFPPPEQIVPLMVHRLLAATRTRLLLAQGTRENAAAQARTLYEAASSTGWHSIAIQALALQALAAPTADEAMPYLSEVLPLAEAEGYRRTFLDLGEPMAERLREAGRRGIAPKPVEQLLAAFAGRPAVEGRPERPRSSPLAEPLSERELEVLHLLADRQTNQEIADALTISINTVKTHLKNIYGKLGVSSRREAIARARQLRFLP